MSFEKLGLGVAHLLEPLSNVRESGFDPQHHKNRAWWHMPVTLALRRLEEGGQLFRINLNCTELKASLACVRACDREKMTDKSWWTWA